MKRQNIIYQITKVAILIFWIALASLFFSCKAKKKQVEKRVQTVSELVKKDIKQVKKSTMDVSMAKTIAENIVETTGRTSVTFDPIIEDRPITVVHNQDTMTVGNAKITFENETTEKETDTKTTTQKTTEKTEKTREKDKTKTKKASENKNKSKKKDVKGGFPWWILIVAGAAFLLWKFGRKIFTKLPGV